MLDLLWDNLSLPLSLLLKCIAIGQSAFITPVHEIDFLRSVRMLAKRIQDRKQFFALSNKQLKLLGGLIDAFCHFVESEFKPLVSIV